MGFLSKTSALQRQEQLKLSMCMLIRDIDCNILMTVCMKSNNNPTVRQLIQFRGDSIKFNSAQYCEENGQGKEKGRGGGGREGAGEGEGAGLMKLITLWKWVTRTKYVVAVLCLDWVATIDRKLAPKLHVQL